jgi:hypothetical protein
MKMCYLKDLEYIYNYLKHHEWHGKPFLDKCPKCDGLNEDCKNYKSLDDIGRNKDQHHFYW